MPDRTTILQIVSPITDDFVALAYEWNSAASQICLGYVWAGYDALVREWSGKKLSVSLKNLERQFTFSLVGHIRDAMSHFEPFDIEHGPIEYESWKGGKSQPPTYDLGFVWRENKRIVWPLEAKVLKHDRDVKEYAIEVNDQFLTCRYAPFSSEAAMLGYLLAGSELEVFDELQIAIPCTLHSDNSLSIRSHRHSMHKRQVEIGKQYPRSPVVNPAF